MFTRNIRFLNFQKIKNKKLNKSELNILKSLNKIKLLSSFKENYNYSYNKKELKKYKKFKHIRIFGMGGSIGKKQPQFEQSKAVGKI